MIYTPHADALNAEADARAEVQQHILADGDGWREQIPLTDARAAELVSAGLIYACGPCAEYHEDEDDGITEYHPREPHTYGCLSLAGVPVPDLGQPGEDEDSEDTPCPECAAREGVHQ